MEKTFVKFFIKRPSAWIPIIIPLIFFAYLVIHITIFGIVREKDEGIGAHIFQLWLVLEPFMVGYFAVKWLPHAPKQAFLVLALQIAAALVACAPVFLLKL
jgi:hypothetical protein